MDYALGPNGRSNHYEKDPRPGKVRPRTSRHGLLLLFLHQLGARKYVKKENETIGMEEKGVKK